MEGGKMFHRSRKDNSKPARAFELVDQKICVLRTPAT